VALLLSLPLLLWGCATPPPAPQVTEGTEKTSQAKPTQTSSPAKADVVSVQVTGSPGNYQFSVEIASPDTGCDQYADWWEVLTEQGELVYRRILTHSHVDEQPFTRAGGPIAIDADRVVIVRAHLHSTGYGGKSWKGTVQSGFVEIELVPDFADSVETEPPQPAGCDF